MESHTSAGSLHDGHIAVLKRAQRKTRQWWEVQEKLFTKEAQPSQFSQGNVERRLAPCLGVAACGRLAESSSPGRLNKIEWVEAEAS